MLMTRVFSEQKWGRGCNVGVRFSVDGCLVLPTRTERVGGTAPGGQHIGGPGGQQLVDVTGPVMDGASGRSVEGHGPKLVGTGIKE